MEFDNKISFDHQTSSFSDIEIVSSGASVSVKNVTFSLPQVSTQSYMMLALTYRLAKVLGVSCHNECRIKFAGKSTLILGCSIVIISRRQGMLRN